MVRCLFSDSTRIKNCPFEFLSRQQSRPQKVEQFSCRKRHERLENRGKRLRISDLLFQHIRYLKNGRLVSPFLLNVSLKNTIMKNLFLLLFWSETDGQAKEVTLKKFHPKKKQRFVREKFLQSAKGIKLT